MVFGEQHGRAILRADEVREIREMLRRGTWSLREIGEAFGVSKSTIADIKMQRTWQNDVEDDALAANPIAASSTATVE